ncbi:acetate--CoA ligase family protein [Actinokineospora sp. PR83]|uniref:acetate--CoA ligase family protein n=1 Tax=Actinokineospora sp. PR83 TaxID=2884908 RepID=UPI001F39E9C4|nr:acetate--CoA ligase family protein [Actinokineospora sp. PR83]MCG8915558.1 acetate--CoA ligase family protein [Actinokineospora sp. PR83]
MDVPALLATADRIAAKSSADGWSDPAASLDLVAAAGVPVTAGHLVPVGAAVAEIVRVVGEHGPVAVKAVTDGLLHKAAEGGVHLGVVDDGGARAAVTALVDRFGDRLRGVFVQPMVELGAEWLVGVRGDARFGPLVVCGPGGSATEAGSGHRVRLCPLTESDVADLVAGADRPHELADVVRRVARLAELVPSVRELDLNPVVIGATGVSAVDARVRLVPTAATDPLVRGWPG